MRLAPGTMAQCDFGVICTASRDKYGRYLTDLFYLPGGSLPMAAP